MLATVHSRAQFGMQAPPVTIDACRARPPNPDGRRTRRGRRPGRCSRPAIERYRGRLSGPLLDRLDLHVHVQPTDISTLLDAHHVRESSAIARLRVTSARARQIERQGALNSAMPPADLERFAPADPEIRELLELTAARSSLSSRACGRILRVARTIADLAGIERVTAREVSEALSFRQLDVGGAGAPRPDAPYARASKRRRPGSGVH